MVNIDVANWMFTVQNKAFCREKNSEMSTFWVYPVGKSRQKILPTDDWQTRRELLNVLMDLIVHLSGPKFNRFRKKIGRQFFFTIQNVLTELFPPNIFQLPFSRICFDVYFGCNLGIQKLIQVEFIIYYQLYTLGLGFWNNRNKRKN